MSDVSVQKPIIKVEDLTIAYDEKPVLWDIDAEINEASITAIIGPNGAGKSTFMKGVLGLTNVLSGHVEIMGKNLKEVQKQISYIPQTSAVNWNFPTTVFDVVLMGRYIHCGWIKRPRKEDKLKALEALERMGMTEFKDRQISRLSGGQKQRVFIARAIASDAQIYFMDEPLAGVDKKSESVIMNFLREVQSEGKTSVVVHHDLNTVPRYFDHVLILNKRMIAQGPLETAFTKESIHKAFGEIAGGEFINV